MKSSKVKSQPSKWIAASLSNDWGQSWWICRYYFGDKYTIFTRLWGSLGREIHVQAFKPVRNECLEILNSFDCDWWTSIEPDNKKAINLAKKCGFTEFKQAEIKDIISCKMVTMIIFRRHYNERCR